MGDRLGSAVVVVVFPWVLFLVFCEPRNARQQWVWLAMVVFAVWFSQFV